MDEEAVLRVENVFLEDAPAEDSISDDSTSDESTSDESISDDSISGESISEDSTSEDSMSDESIFDDSMSSDSISEDFVPEDDDSPNEGFFSGSRESSSTVDNPSSLFKHVWHTPDAKGSPPRATYSQSANVVGYNQVYVFGGTDGNAALGDLYVLNLGSDKMVWRQLNISNSPPERYNHATAVVDLKLFIHGGFGEGGRLDDLHVLDTQALTWTTWTPHGRLPGPRSRHTLNRVGDKLYLFGGFNKRGSRDSMHVLDIATQSWTRPKISGRIPKSRSRHSMTALNTLLILFGGSNFGMPLNDLHVFHTEKLMWTKPRIRGDPPPRLKGHSATLIGDRMYVFGGNTGTKHSSRIYMLETTSFKWFNPQEVKGAPSGRSYHSSFSIGPTRLFVFGGWNGTFLNDLHFLDIRQLTTDMLTCGSTRNQACNMGRLIGDSKFSDVTLVVDGHDIPAHRCILAANSDYFSSMVSGPMKESQQDRITILECKYVPFMVFLKFLYTGRLCEDRPSIVCDVMGMADMFCVDQLKILCENYLKHSVESENVCFILEHANKYQAADLKRFCRNHIRNHAEEVSKTEGFESVSRSPAMMMDIVRLLKEKSIIDGPSYPATPTIGS